MEEQKTSSVYAAMTSEKRVDIGGLVDGEREAIEGALNGHYWITVRDGRIQKIPARETPLSEVDEGMLPFWRAFDQKQEGLQLKLVEFEPIKEGYSPAIFIQSLCGYNYTPATYRHDAAVLEEYGFICMRSRRSEDGRYWEIWYLPGLWAAKGRLKEALGAERASEKKKLERAFDFFHSRKCQVTFGTLDVTVQRMAMEMD